MAILSNFQREHFLNTSGEDLKGQFKTEYPYNASVMKFKKGDRVKQIGLNRKGTVVGIWENDFFINKDTDDPVLFASKGQYKVRMDGDSKDSFSTLYSAEIEKL